MIVAVKSNRENLHYGLSTNQDYRLDATMKSYDSLFIVNCFSKRKLSLNFCSTFVLFLFKQQCKNQLVTISNLRVALEETKRNGSSSVSLFSGLRYSQPPLRSPTAALNGQGGSTSDCVSDSVSSQQQNHQQQRLQEALPTAITSTNTGMASTISPSLSSSSSVSNVGPSNASTNTNATDYWSAIGRALFSGFDS